MSENIPESIPTSADPRSHRPLKRRALSPASKQAAHLSTLFANPDREIATSSSLTTTRTPNASAPPEIVANVQGSSAGAGSGEFHVYKASRRREYERLRAMDEETEKEKADGEFERSQEERRKADEEKTARNRAKREKAKLRQTKKKGVADGEGDKMEGGVVKKDKFKPNGVVNGAAKKSGEVDAPAVVNEEIGIVIHDED